MPTHRADAPPLPRRRDLRAARAALPPQTVALQMSPVAVVERPAVAVEQLPVVSDWPVPFRETRPVPVERPALFTERPMPADPSVRFVERPAPLPERSGVTPGRSVAFPDRAAGFPRTPAAGWDRAGFADRPAEFGARSAGFPEPAPSFPEPAARFPEPAARFPEPAPRFPEPAARFPEPAPRFADPTPTPAPVPVFPERPATFPQQAEPFPDPRRSRSQRPTVFTPQPTFTPPSGVVTGAPVGFGAAGVWSRAESAAREVTPARGTARPGRTSRAQNRSRGSARPSTAGGAARTAQPATRAESRAQSRAAARAPRSGPRLDLSSLTMPQVGIASAIGLATIAAPLAGALASGPPVKVVTNAVSTVSVAPAPSFPQVSSTGMLLADGRLLPDAMPVPSVPSDLTAPRTVLVDRVSRSSERAVLPGCNGEVPRPSNRNGEVPASDLCTLWDGKHQARADAAVALAKLNIAYRKRFGHNICITDGYRTLAQQYAVKAARGGFAATPGTSNHGWGLAVDLCDGIEHNNTATYQWMRANAAAYGWDNPDWALAGGSGPFEPWHWEYFPGVNATSGHDQ